jgi:RES domain-containing protein
MRLFRIAKTQYINDLSGAGARANGGRWNRVGVGLVYTSPSRSLATVDTWCTCRWDWHQKA